MVLITFVVTFIIRIMYEAFGYYQFTKQRAEDSFMCEFTSTMEIIVGCIVYFSFPIGLLCFLHYRNAQPAKTMLADNGS